MKKIAIIAMLFLLLSSVSYGIAVASNSPMPATYSGDGIPSGNQNIQPDISGMGPAPNCGDGFPDGSGF
jgi:hypothetical protein